MKLTRLKILVTGQVQGVGFRPHVFRTATKLNLTGWVQNNGLGVLIEIQGAKVERFLAILLSNIPPLANIDKIKEQFIPHIANEQSFTIKDSAPGKVRTIISPDIGICEDCLRELFDPNSHYYLYPFLNCTNCGPRFTITRNLPYDRRQTSMDIFSLCEKCAFDYHNPLDRRYHAQPTACNECGPQLQSHTDTLLKISSMILDGKIVGLKGLGGYQIICDARQQQTVQSLRAKKNRQTKPFALMVLNIASARNIVKLTKTAEELLKSKERPIVISPKLYNSKDNFIAPYLNNYGIMLPNSPLHYLLFYTLLGKPQGSAWLTEAQQPLLIVTSANVSGEPLLCDDESANLQLSTIVDEVFSYNRQIVCRVDDSVLTVINNKPLFIRRARGYVPNRIKLAHEIPVTLALGAHLKNTFCLTRGNEAFVSQYIGSLNNKATIDFLHESLQHFMSFLNVKPERIAHDLHPDFYTTQLACDLAEKYNIKSHGVLHHHAHLASLIAEHNISTKALGLVLDGYGYGASGEAWGGELMYLDKTSVLHLGSLAPIPQPGCDKATYEPWRMAASALHCLGKKEQIAERFAKYEHAKYIVQLLDKNINSPLTSSCGRLFDAASALLNITSISNYEGEAAMRLESFVTKPQVLANGWRDLGSQIDFLPTLDFIAGLTDPVMGANIFHGTLVKGLTTWILKFARQMQIKIVLLSGGCFVNKFLAEGIYKELQALGLEVILPRALPPNDGGISLGQAWLIGNLGQ